MDRLGIMGGTFDPIHYGHLVAAEMARSEFALSKVLFIPSGSPPHKELAKVSSASLRHEMVSRAIADNNFFEVSKIELERQGPSYTIDTLRSLRETLAGYELFFITGADALREVFNWRQAGEIFTLTQLIGATRPGFDVKGFLETALLEYSEIQGRIHLLEVPALAISSTDIRQRVAGGRSIRYLLPEPVRLFIQETNLYKEFI
ncbi:MAG: nicotinate-nucleotide adenylyltransferase [Desulfitobacteriaceae bacterium]